MWIRNKVTNTLQEIHNADVIKICKKEPEKYELSEEYPGDNEEVKAAAQAAAEKKAEEEAEKAAKEAEAKAKAEGAAKKVEEEAAQAAAQAAGGEGAGNDATPEDYANKKINDLRKIAKEKGIQGYNNMDKATLVAVIQAH
jgi:hypothetical protein